MLIWKKFTLCLLLIIGILGSKENEMKGNSFKEKEKEGEISKNDEKEKQENNAVEENSELKEEIYNSEIDVTENVPEKIQSKETTNEAKLNEEQCNLCYEKFSETRIKLKTECNHEFCGMCYLEWFIPKQQCPNCRQCPKSSIYAPIIQCFNEEDTNKVFINTFLSKFPEALNDHPDQISLYEEIKKMNYALEPYFVKAELLLWNILLEDEDAIEILLNERKVNPNITPSVLYYEDKLQQLLDHENVDPNLVTIYDHFKQRLKLLLPELNVEEFEEENLSNDPEEAKREKEAKIIYKYYYEKLKLVLEQQHLNQDVLPMAKYYLAEIKTPRFLVSNAYFFEKLIILVQKYKRTSNNFATKEKEEIQKFIPLSDESFMQDTPLNIALKIGNLRIAKKLIEHGASVNHENFLGHTTLFEVVGKGNIEHVAFLLKNRANPNLPEYEDGTSLLLPMARAKTAKMAKLLYSYGAQVLDRVDDEGITFLHTACEKGNMKLVKFFLKIWQEGEEDIDVLDDNEETPLAHAIRKNQTNVAKLLLKHESDPNVLVSTEHEDIQYTLLQHAILEDNEELCKILIAHDARPFFKNTEGKNALDVAKNNLRLLAKILKFYSKRINLKRKRDDNDNPNM